jgi:hypothetical protein
LRAHSGQRDGDGIYLGRIVVVDGFAAGAMTGSGGIRWMLVGPRRITAGRVNDAENCVRAHEVPTVDWSAVVSGVAFELQRIDRLNAAVDAGWSASVQLALVDVDSFIKLGGCPGRRRTRCTSGRTGASNAVSGCNRRRIERTIISDVVESAFGARAAARDDGSQSRKRIRRLGGRRVQIGDALFRELGEIGTIGRACRRC